MLVPPSGVVTVDVIAAEVVDVVVVGSVADMTTRIALSLVLVGSVRRK